MSDITNQEMANAIRFLSIDAIERANSGHPGMPMGMADVASVLFNEFLVFYPKKPKWFNRDRFVLSAGHGSMLLYSLLYLTGYEDITIDDIKNFRQLGYNTAGHPEYGMFDGVEMTTGPLGQGLATAVGMAISERLLSNRFKELIDYKIYSIAGDGCLMEGISQEAISLAGHLKLSNLILFWDNNNISIDGEINLTNSDNTKLRFESCNWEVIQIDGHNFNQIRQAIKFAHKIDKPVMIDCKTQIAYGSPNKSNSNKSHGSPLGEDEVKLTRKSLGWNYKEFEIPKEILSSWRRLSNKYESEYTDWNKKAEKVKFYQKVENDKKIDDIKWQNFRNELIKNKTSEATRKSSEKSLEVLTKEIGFLIGGSADLTSSVNTKTEYTIPINRDDFSGRYIHYGVREHAMAAIMNGIALSDVFIPYGGTFLVFSDYMKPAIRLSALMKKQVIYILTHDSIGLGEDGPTHQPIEHLASLRSIPNLNLFRPCDGLEVVDSFKKAIETTDKPSAIILTRQNVNFIPREDYDNHISKGGYILSGSKNSDLTIVATGSEVNIALEVRNKLSNYNINTKLVSIPCLEIFNSQSKKYKLETLLSKTGINIVIEAGVCQGWEGFYNNKGFFVGMSSFGASGKAKSLFKHFEIESGIIADKILSYLKKVN